MDKFLAAIPEDPIPEILWTLNYTKQVPRSLLTKELAKSTSENFSVSSPPPPHGDPLPAQSRIITLPELGPDLALDDSVLLEVRAAWERIVGEEKGDGFMVFEDRGDGVGEGEDDGGDDGGDGDGF